MELLTKEQRVPVLTYARRLCETGECRGMCQCIRSGIDYEFGVARSFYVDFADVASEFNYTVAKDMFGAAGSPVDYWWPLSDRESRIKYFNWLIEQEKIK